jgi:hypothetical protein
MAQAFRYSRVSLFIAVPSVLKPMGANGVGECGEVLANIRWYAGRKDRTVDVAVSSAVQEKELGNAWVLTNGRPGADGSKVGEEKYEEAVWRYILGLAALTPWSSDRTMFSWDEAGLMGLRQM